ncbi:MAG: hypothetical protein KF878_19600 [Planctomycetes bacterium]|nr:hypothetical protein [Planctomycetota bacterium]
MSTAVAKIKSVAADKDAKLELRVAGGKAGDPVTFTIYKVSDDSQLDTIDGTIQKGKAVATWTAKGPAPDAAARAWRVYYSAVVDGVTATSPEMEVYLPDVEVSSVGEDDAALADMRFELAVLEGKKKTKTVKGHTGSSGTFKVQNLPPGEVQVTWLAPARLIDWVEDTAGKKKARLKKSFTAELVFPPAGDHKQYVNLPATKDHPEWGNKLKVRMRVHPDDGPSRPGDEFFVKVEYPPEDQLSKRKVPARKLAGAKAQAWADLGTTVKVKAEGAEGTVELELGLAGGDQVTLKVGGTDTCEDAEVTITNWRKLFYVMQRNAGSVIHGMQRTADTLADVFVEYERHDEVTFTKADTPPSMAGSWVAGKEFGVATEQLVIGSHNRKWFREKFAKVAIPKDMKQCTIDLIVCDQQYDGVDGWSKPHKDTTTTKLTTDNGWSEAFDGELFPANLNDAKHPMTSGSWRCTAPKGKPGHGVKGTVTQEMITVDRSKETKKVHIDLTKAPKGDPASLVGDGTADKYPVEVTITVVFAKGPYLGESANEHQLIVLTAGADCFNDTVVHELGHNMRQAPSKGNKPPAALKLDDHPHKYEGHGHTGPHCAHNLDAVATHVWADDYSSKGPVATKATDEPDYDLLCDAAGDLVHGDCVMYGSGPSDDPSPSAGFCDDCKPYVLAKGLESVR